MAESRMLILPVADPLGSQVGEGPVQLVDLVQEVLFTQMGVKIDDHGLLLRYQDASALLIAAGAGGARTARKDHTGSSYLFSSSAVVSTRGQGASDLRRV